MNVKQFNISREFLVTNYNARKQQFELLFKITKNVSYLDSVRTLQYPTIDEIVYFSNEFNSETYDVLAEEVVVDFLIESFWDKFNIFIEYYEKTDYVPDACLTNLEILNFPTIAEIKEAMRVLEG